MPGGRPRKPKPLPPRRPRGTGSISIAADGTIRARLPSSVDPKRSAREFRPDQLGQAEAWLDAMLTGQPATASAAMTLGDWVGHWHATYVEPIRPPNTAHAYLYALRQLSALYARPLREIRPSELQAEIGRLATRVDATTVHAVAGVWRRCLEAAVDDELVDRNPARRLVLPKTSRKPAPRTITPVEASALRAAIVGHRFEAAYALLLGCGLRIGEVLGLRWADVDLRRSRIWVEQQHTNGHFRPLPKARNPHHVPLPAFVKAALIRHRNQQAPGCVLVLQSPHGRLRKRDRKADPIWPWSRFTIADDLVLLLDRLGIEKMTPHAARHGLASMLLAGGVDPTVIAERLGNTPAIVLNTYSHPGSAGRERADALVEEYLGGGPSSAEATG